MEKLTSILLITEGMESGTRILEKTVVLARHFGARVELLLGDPRDAKDFAALCTARGYDEVMLCSVFRCVEPLNDVVLRRAFERSPDLVVKARSRGHGKDSSEFDREDQQLAAMCPVPLILMHEHPWRSPVRIAAAVDISLDDSALPRSLVHTAGFLSLGVEGGLDVLYSEREQQDETLRMARVVKLARLVREFRVDGESVRHINGTPEETLPRIAAAGDYDILILGALTHREGLSVLHTPLTRRLVEAFDGDVVLVKADSQVSASRRGVPVKSRAML